MIYVVESTCYGLFMRFSKVFSTCKSLRVLVEKCKRANYTRSTNYALICVNNDPIIGINI